MRVLIFAWLIPAIAIAVFGIAWLEMQGATRIARIKRYLRAVLIVSLAAVGLWYGLKGKDIAIGCWDPAAVLCPLKQIE